jgi:hypothetical protein
MGTDETQIQKGILTGRGGNRGKGMSYNRQKLLAVPASGVSQWEGEKLPTRIG